MNLINYKIFWKVLSYTQSILGSEESKEIQLWNVLKSKQFHSVKWNFAWILSLHRKTLYIQRNKFLYLVKLDPILIAIILFRSNWHQTEFHCHQINRKCVISYPIWLFQQDTEIEFSVSDVTWCEKKKKKKT